jgi:hypothetical protein
MTRCWCKPRHEAARKTVPCWPSFAPS